jgi:hypothetical protein
MSTYVVDGVRPKENVLYCLDDDGALTEVTWEEE